MPTIREEIQAKVHSLEAAYGVERAKLEADLAAIGPLAEHEVESLKTWVAAVVKHFGL